MSGYGVIYKDTRNKVLLAGYAPDTALDYPKNILYDILAVDMAIKMRVSMDIPVGELPAMYDDYHNTLMNSISRDSFCGRRINNVYGR